MTDHSAVKQRLEDLKFSLSEITKTLEDEQSASEQAHDDWDQGSEDEEPDVIDNSEEITRIENAIYSLDDAIGHLTNE